MEFVASCGQASNGQQPARMLCEQSRVEQDGAKRTCSESLKKKYRKKRKKKKKRKKRKKNKELMHN